MAKKSDNTMLYVLGGLAVLLFLRSRSQIQATQSTPTPNWAGETPIITQLPNGTVMASYPPGGAPMDILTTTAPGTGGAPVGVMSTNNGGAQYSPDYHIGLPIFLGPPIKADPYAEEDKPGSYLPPPPPQMDMN